MFSINQSKPLPRRSVRRSWSAWSSTVKRCWAVSCRTRVGRGCSVGTAATPATSRGSRPPTYRPSCRATCARRPSPTRYVVCEGWFLFQELRKRPSASAQEGMWGKLFCDISKEVVVEKVPPADVQVVMQSYVRVQAVSDKVCYREGGFVGFVGSWRDVSIDLPKSINMERQALVHISC